MSIIWWVPGGAGVPRKEWSQREVLDRVWRIDLSEIARKEKEREGGGDRILFSYFRPHIVLKGDLFTEGMSVFEGLPRN